MTTTAAINTRATRERDMRARGSQEGERASVLAGKSRERSTSRLQRRLDLTEAVDRANPVPVAKRMLAVPSLFEQGREDARRIAGYAQSVDRETLELVGCERVLVRDPARSEEGAELLEASEDHRTDVSTFLEVTNRCADRDDGRLSGVRRRESEVPVRIGTVRPSEDIQKPSDRREDRDNQEHLDGPTCGCGPDRRESPGVRGRRVRLRPRLLAGPSDRPRPPD